MSEPYRRKRSFYQDVSGSLKVTSATDDSTLQASKTSYTIYLQKIHVEVTAGSAAVTWTIKDSAGTPVLLVPSLDASAIVHYDFDFGPEGIPLTEAKDLLLDVSAAGAVGWVSWEAYLKLTGAAHA